MELSPYSRAPRPLYINRCKYAQCKLYRGGRRVCTSARWTGPGASAGHRGSVSTARVAMAGCRVKNVHYHCKEDSWTPIESALIKLVRENPPLYTRGGRGSRTKKLMVSLMWSDISDQLGLPGNHLFFSKI